MKKKVLIIGSGVAGAGIGALLASNGYDVKLFEKNSLIGGRFTTKKINGWNLDLGCHIIANCEKGSIGEILRQCGEPQEKIKWSYTRKPGPKFFYNNKMTGLSSLIFNLDLPFHDIYNLIRLFFQIYRMKPGRIRELMKVRSSDFLAGYTKDPRASALLTYFCGLFYVVYKDASAGEWAMALQNLIRNHRCGYPIGGTIAIPEAYCNIIKKYNGSIFLKTKIDKIIVDNGRAAGIKLKDGTFIDADIVISNSGIKTLVFDLIGEEKFPPEFAGKVRNYEYSMTALVLKIALKKKITNENMLMFLSFDDIIEEIKKMNLIPPGTGDNFKKLVQSITFETLCRAIDRPGLKGYVPERHAALFLPVVSNLDPSAAPDGKQLLFAGAGLPGAFAHVKDYEKWTESVMASLRKIFPGIDEHIEWVKVTSPKEINAYGGEEGNIIGVAQTIDQVDEGRPSHRLPGIQNVFECSADTGSHGIGGELAADSALRLYSSLTGKKVPLFN